MRHGYIHIHSAKVKPAGHASKEARLWARLNARADWSAELVSNAVVADLDSTVLAVMRQRFAEKHLHWRVRLQAGTCPRCCPSPNSAGADN